MMNLDRQSGMVDQARQIPSPNKNSRPKGMAVDALIIHAISLPKGIYDNAFVEDFFCNCLDCSQSKSFETIRNAKVSSHFYIKRNGELIQFVSTQKRAWHAGVSQFQGRADVNDFSIGIELQGCDEDKFASEQYATLHTLTAELCQAYPLLNVKQIAGHSDIAPGRKTDPGPGFDWNRYFNGLK